MNPYLGFNNGTIKGIVIQKTPIKRGIGVTILTLSWTYIPLPELMAISSDKVIQKEVLRTLEW